MTLLCLRKMLIGLDRRQREVEDEVQIGASILSLQPKCRLGRHPQAPRFFRFAGEALVFFGFGGGGSKHPQSSFHLPWSARRAELGLVAPGLLANADRICNDIGSAQCFTRLGDIIATAWQWFRRKPSRSRSDLPQGLDL
jgi:hypothetical protein